MNVVMELRCQGCGKLYAQVEKEGDRSMINILEGINLDQINREENTALMLCNCGHKSLVDTRLFEDCPAVPPGDPRSKAAANPPRGEK
jgi:hypothetical protein